MRGRRWVLVGSMIAAAAGGAASDDASRAIAYGPVVAVPDVGPINPNGGTSQAVVADVTGDGVDDLVVFSGVALQLAVHAGRTDGGFDSPYDVAIDVGQPGLVTAARLNADAAFDLVCGRGYASGLDVFLSDGSGGFTRTTLYTADPPPYGVVERHCVADWDADGNTDILSIDQYGVFRVRPGDGAGGFGVPETTALSPSEYAASVFAADLDGDGLVDLVRCGAWITVFWRGADGSLSEGTRLLQEYGGSLATADVDGDGRADLVAMTARGNFVLRQKAERTFTASHLAVPWQGGYWPGVLVADLNGDSRPEIVTTSGIYVNRGDGAFGPLLPLPRTAAFIAFSDRSGDARPELVLTGGADGGAGVVAVVNSSAGPPHLTSVSPAAVHVGSVRDLDVACVGVAPHAFVDAGSGVDDLGVSIGDPSVFSTVMRDPGTLRVTLQVAQTAAPGPRTLTVLNPDGGTASIAYEILAGGDAGVVSITPPRARPGDTLRVVVRATNFVSGAWGFFRAVPGSPSFETDPSGGLVNFAGELDPSGEYRLFVTVSPTAEPGPRSFLVLNGTGVQTEYSDLFRIVARSLELDVERGVLAPGQGDGAVSVKGSLAVLEPGAAFDPRTEDAEIRCGDMTAPLVLNIPRGDRRWRVHRNRMVWTSPRGATPRVRLLLDFRAGEFRLDASRAVVDGPTDAEIGVDFALGDLSGGSTASWTEADDGSWTFGTPPLRPRR